MKLLQWLHPWIPAQPVRFQERIAWAILLLLSPLALFWGVSLEGVGAGTHSSALTRLTRGESFALAQQFALVHHLDLRGWRAYCVVDGDKPLLEYTTRYQSKAARLAAQYAGPSVVRTIFVSPDGKQQAVITLGLNGQIQSYDLHSANTGVVAGTGSEETAAENAKGTLDSLDVLTKAVHFGRPEVTHVSGASDNEIHQFTWHGSAEGHPELIFKVDVFVEEWVVVGRTISATVNPEFVRANLEPNSRLLSAYNVVYVLYLIALVIYAGYRYVRRAAAKEVSRSRTFLITGIIAVVFGLNFVSSFDEQVWTNIKNGAGIAPITVLVVIFTFVSFGMGMLAGIAYGSAEGDLRESYPGKLTSLDTLLLGRIFSRNVASSVVFGVAWGGWIILLHFVVEKWLPNTSPWFWLYGLKPAFFRLPLATLVFSQLVSSILAVAAGMMIPLAFVQRTFSKPAVRIAVFLCAGLVAIEIPREGVASLGGEMATLFLSLAALLIPFFRYDLLASIVSYGTFSVLFAATYIGTASMRLGSLEIAGGAALLFLLAQVYFSFRGREYSDDEVRPVYARNLAERLSLQAEVAAAREAQLRLLPESIPQIAGLSTAAFCLPARVVGGDFYDFFVLGEQRLGIFLAEGDNRGLASALSIALAKGFLMHTAQSGLPPTEVLVRLETALGNFLNSGAGKASVAYAVIDTMQGTLRYARTGRFPQFLANGRHGAQLEREVSIPGRVQSAEPIYEGAATLSEGDSLLLYTGGLASRLAAKLGQSRERWLGALAVRGTSTVGQLEHALLNAVLPQGKREGSRTDDLTAVVIRVGRITGEKAMEGVA